MKAVVRIGLSVAVAVVVVPSVWAATQDVDRKLQSVERALEERRDRERHLDDEAKALEREIADLRSQLVRAAKAVQSHEGRLTELEDRLMDLAQSEAESTAALRRRRMALVATIGALERIGRQPPEILIVAATDADAIRTSVLLRSVVPALHEDARSLRDELDGLAALRQGIAAEREEVEATNAELATERQKIDDLLQRKSEIQVATLEQRRRAEEEVARLATEAGNLRELLERLAVIATAPPPPEYKPATRDGGMGPDVVAIIPPQDDTLPRPGPRSFAAARGTLPLPVRGRVVGLFNQTTENGTISKGLRIETRPLAQVVNLYDGRVVFAGEFRGYGQLLIIEHGEGYHTLLAGFSRIDSVLGQWLLAGEPVGVMGSGTGDSPYLYVELRRNGEAINPLPWLAASVRKVNG